MGSVGGNLIKSGGNKFDCRELQESHKEGSLSSLATDPDTGKCYKVTQGIFQEFQKHF